MTKRIIIVAIISTFLLSACGGRAAHPLKAFGSDDGRMSCDDISAEQAKNNSNIGHLRAEKDTRKQNNISILFVFWSVFPLFFLDLNNSQDIEIDAFNARNNRLQDIAILKQCPTVRQ